MSVDTRFVFAAVLAVIIAAVALAVTRRRSMVSPGNPPPDGENDSLLALDAFWIWWRDAADRLARTIDEGRSVDLADEIGRRVRAIDARLAWELGPGKRSRHHFALSPEGDPEARVLTERWLSRAPAPDSTWEFYPARQASWRPGLTLELSGVKLPMDEHRLACEIDSHREVAHLRVWHPAYSELGEKDRGLAAFLFLDELLGEDSVEKWVGRMEVSIEPLLEAQPPDALLQRIEEISQTATGERFAILDATAPDGSPLVATVNLAVKRVDHLLMDCHLELELELDDPTEAGLTTNEEAGVLNGMEDELLEILGHDIVYIGRETGLGRRVIHMHAAVVGPAEQRIREWMRRHPERHSELTTTHDPCWSVLDKWR